MCLSANIYFIISEVSAIKVCMNDNNRLECVCHCCLFPLRNKRIAVEYTYYNKIN